MEQRPAGKLSQRSWKGVTVPWSGERCLDVGHVLVVAFEKEESGTSSFLFWLSNWVLGSIY